MKLHELSPAAGSTRESWRVGRGTGSGNGKTSGRGHKGAKARSGYSSKRGFEGGQMPLARRLPKRGFNNIHARPLTAVNLSAFGGFKDGDVVSAQTLLEAGILSKCKYGLKVLGGGELTAKITVRAQAFSESAAAKIAAAGGKAEVEKRD
ncbi:MAG: 50S ribosomal protein L15 [Oscillospiraceae bacterium]|jgi:large subunit ribosomal protein L15|nr:50S ribosomal protein L15 [Oscillospiraceae bacterium]